MRSALRQVRSIAKPDARIPHATIPAFLCPVLLQSPCVARRIRAETPHCTKKFSTFNRYRREAVAANHEDDFDPSLLEKEDEPLPPDQIRQSLPRSCPGCGAPSQEHNKDEAGYYNADRKQVKAFLEYDQTATEIDKVEDEFYNDIVGKANPEVLKELGLDKESILEPARNDFKAPETPMCDRCHNLIHHRVGNPIHHPSVEAIQQTIAESPHRRNHIYHVLDAADFPLSLVPNLQSALRLPKLRTQNRRAKHKGWVGDNRIAEVSFIVTRADLLAPLKEQVDKLLPYIQDVLRDALGRANKGARLGNVHLVSAKRGWWTKKVKEDIWDRGGAGWMVGKVNVGKSNLFEVVFPKGRGSDYQDVRKMRTAAERQAMLSSATTAEETAKIEKQLAEEDAEIERRRRQPVLEPEDKLPEDEAEEDQQDAELDDPNALLPPRQPYTPYPVLPLASPLPGTTASPIRIPFGRDRGELIDLPGLARTTPELSTFVLPSAHSQLTMRQRVTPERLVLKPGQSLILGGGLIRITPTTPDLIFLVHPFVPLHAHVTATEKAVEFQNQTRAGSENVPSILQFTPPSSSNSNSNSPSKTIKSAGTYKLKWDVTKKLAGPLTSKQAGKMRPENLPFVIWSADLLIEGVGWVEISAQVRKGRGWKPVGMVSKDPNALKKEKEARIEEDRQRRLENYLARQKERDGEEGDAFDRAGITGGGGGGGAEERYRNREVGAERRKRDHAEEFVNDLLDPFPEIEVFSPLGKYVGWRMPLCGSVLGGPRPVSSRDRKARPRRSMVSVKGQRKAGGG